MHVIDHNSLPRERKPGHLRFAAASEYLGSTHMQIWIETLEPNARTELVPLGTQRVAVVLSGHGNLLIDGAPQRFHAPCSLVLPAGSEAVVVNIGSEPRQFVSAYVALPGTQPIGPPPIG